MKVQERKNGWCTAKTQLRESVEGAAKVQLRCSESTAEAERTYGNGIIKVQRRYIKGISQRRHVYSKGTATVKLTYMEVYSRYAECALKVL